MSVDFNSIAIGCAMTAATHPFTYAKVLVQLGHEPLEPVLRRNVYFRKQWQYPSVFQYLKHIQKTDGSLGLYRGLFPRIWANATTSITYSLVSKALSSKDKEVKQTRNQSTIIYVLKQIAQEEDQPPSLPFKTVCEKTSKEMAARCAAVIISQPFHVVAIRSMAQFVGHETIYDTMHGAFVEIYTEDGVIGFFAGIAPRLLSEIISLWMCNLLTYAVNTYIITDSSDLKDLRDYTHMIMGYISQTATYPLSVTSTIMAANGAKIAAGRLPHIPVYDSWLACLKDLHKMGQTSRGSSMFFRKAVAHAYAAGSVMPVPAPSFS